VAYRGRGVFRSRVPHRGLHRRAHTRPIPCPSYTVPTTLGTCSRALPLALVLDRWRTRVPRATVLFVTALLSLSW